MEFLEDSNCLRCMFLGYEERQMKENKGSFYLLSFLSGKDVVNVFDFKRKDGKFVLKEKIDALQLTEKEDVNIYFEIVVKNVNERAMFVANIIDIKNVGV